MPWNEPGGNDRDPWSGGGGGKKGKSSSPDLDALLDKINNRLNKLFGGNSDNNQGSGVLILLALLFVAWMLSGFYTIEEGERGVELRFGAYSETTRPGWHWHFPTPIEAVEKVHVDQNRSAADRSSMLTRDENIVDISVATQYRIKNVEDYLFNVFMPDLEEDQTQGTLHQVMRGAVREVIGRNNMDDILVEGREKVATDTRFRMQATLDKYKSGLEVLKVNLTDAKPPTQVEDAFNDAIKAREDEVRLKNQAETHAKGVIPQARGRAARLIEEANADKEQAIARSEGDANRFSQLFGEYARAPEITRQRLYLETMEEVFASNRKVIIDNKDGNNLMYLPLDQMGTMPVRDHSSTTGSGLPAAIVGQAAEAAIQRENESKSSSTQGRENRFQNGGNVREAR